MYLSTVGEIARHINAGRSLNKEVRDRCGILLTTVTDTTKTLEPGPIEVIGMSMNAPGLVEIRSVMTQVVLTVPETVPVLR